MINLGPEDAGEAFDTGRGHQGATCARWRPWASPSSPPSTAPRSAVAWRSRSACHHRIIADVPGAVVGFPEVTLGLLPGGGGVTRTRADVRHPEGVHGGAEPGHPVQAGQGQGDRPRRRGAADRRRAGARRQGVDQGQPRRAHAAVGRQGLQDARRHAAQPGPGRHPAVVPGPAARSSSRVRRCPRRAPSWTPRSRARRWTSTPPAASRAATSPSWSPARSPRT